MVPIRCRACGHRFPAPETPISLVIRCPMCNQALRLSPEGEQMPAAGGIAGYNDVPRRRHPLSNPRVIVLGSLLLVTVAVWALVIYNFVTGSGPPRAWYGQRQERGQSTGPNPGVLIGGGEPKSPADLYREVSPAVVRISVRKPKTEGVGGGSGFFVSGDGLIATCFHVIDGASQAVVLTDRGEVLTVLGVAAADTEADLALLRVRGSDRPHLALSADALPEVGTRVYAVGSPGGLTNTLSEGLVSGHRRQGTRERIQHNAPTSGGSSGSPLVTANGTVVGVHTSRDREGQNLSFAVPAERIRRLLANRGELRPLDGLAVPDKQPKPSTTTRTTATATAGSPQPKPRGPASLPSTRPSTTAEAAASRTM